MQGCADVFQAVPPLALAQRVNFLFGGFQDFRRGAHLIGNHFRNIRGGLSQSTEHGLFLDDSGIAPHIDSGRGDFHELEDIFPGIVVVDTQLLHLVQHGHRVNGLGEIEHRIDGLVDFPVLL